MLNCDSNWFMLAHSKLFYVSLSTNGELQLYYNYIHRVLHTILSVILKLKICSSFSFFSKNSKYERWLHRALHTIYDDTCLASYTNLFPFPSFLKTIKRTPDLGSIFLTWCMSCMYNVCDVFHFFTYWSRSYVRCVMMLFCSSSFTLQIEGT